MEWKFRIEVQARMAKYTLMWCIMRKQCGCHSNRCLIYIKHRVQMLWSISSISMRMVNWRRRQPVGNSDKFD